MKKIIAISLVAVLFVLLTFGADISTSSNFTVGDVNGNGTVDIADALEILKIPCWASKCYQ
jgi:hypothetical protein